jgi:hypothetical protein
MSQEGGRGPLAAWKVLCPLPWLTSKGSREASLLPEPGFLPVPGFSLGQGEGGAVLLCCQRWRLSLLRLCVPCLVFLAPLDANQPESVSKPPHYLLPTAQSCQPRTAAGSCVGAAHDSLSLGLC